LARGGYRGRGGDGGIDGAGRPHAQERFSLMLDRPFFCAIRDHQTGAVLFIGSIVEPK
jgi:serpin B